MRGNGRIFLRGGAYWVAYYLRGEEYREAAKTKDGKNTGDPDTAAKFLRARLKEVHADEIGARVFTTPASCRLSIHELSEGLKMDFELRGKSSPQNVSVLKRVDADFGAIRAVDLTAEKIDRYVEQRLGDDDRPATINRTLQMLGQCFALAIRRGTLSRSPYIRRLSEVGNARQGFFSETELAAVISHLPAGLRDFVGFAAATGMRKGECCSLTWSDIEGDVLTLRGEHAKNGEARSVPLVGEIKEIIERRKADRLVKENGTTRMVEHIFHREGKPVVEFRKSWATACVAAGLGTMVCPKCLSEGTAHECEQCEVATRYHGRIFHDLRRSAIRNMIQAGTPQVVAMKISGHKTASMFQRYNIVATEDLRTALERTQQYRATAAKQQVIAMR